jgi:hypothetical protein
MTRFIQPLRTGGRPGGESSLPERGPAARAQPEELDGERQRGNPYALQT